MICKNCGMIQTVMDYCATIDGACIRYGSTFISPDNIKGTK